MNRKLTYMLLLLTVVAIIGVPQAAAFQSYLNNFNTTYPSAVGTRIDTCVLCHQGDPRIGGSTDRNTYGAAFGSNNHNFATIEPLDSDNDGFTNIDEIHNLTFPGNATDFPPKIVSFSPATPVSDTGTPATRTFSIVVNQVVNTVTWFLDGTAQKTENSVSASNFAVTTSMPILHNVTAVAQKTGDGSAMQKWDWNVTTVTPIGNGTIAGKVTNFSSGLPISGATVTADGKMATTDNSGNYNITIASGTYTVTASAAGYQSSTPASVTVAANATTTQNFALTKIITNETGTIAGMVTNFSSGSPISGATVTANGKTATTGASGNYSITIAPGTYNVTASAAGYENITVPGVIVTANTTNAQDFELIPSIIIPGNGTIAGKVTNASSGLPIPGATVKANNKTTTTDTNGNYSISLAPSTYTVTASAAGYQDSTATVVVIANATTTQNFNLTKIVPTENGTIAGKVTNASSGLPISGATVTADGKMATTNVDGNYSITIAAPGPYTVTANATGYEDKTVTGVTVTANTTTTLDFALTPKPIPVETGTIAGKVTDANTSSPISGATVTADGKTATTNADGNYSITVAPGTYTVTASAAGYEDKTATGVTVTANATTTQNFALTKIVPTENGSISGRVINVATNTGIPNVDISLIGIVGKGADTKSIKMETTTDSTGMWEFNNLPAGRYIIIEKLPKGYIPITPPVMNIMLEQGENSMDNDFKVKPISALMPPMQAMES